MTTTVTITADDFTSVGVAASAAITFTFTPVHASISTPLVSSKSFSTVTDVTGAATVIIPDAVAGNGVRIDSTFAGWSSVTVAGYPTGTISIATLVNTYPVDPSTLATVTAPAAWYGALAGYAQLTKVTPINVTNTAPTMWRHNPYDSTSSAYTIALPTSVPDGTEFSAEKVNGTTYLPGNVITLQGSLRGVPGATISLTLAHQQLGFVFDGVNQTWWPNSGQKTLSSLDGRYHVATSGVGLPTTQLGTYTLGAMFFRTDTPTIANQRIYICTVAGTPGTWVGIL